MSGKYTRLLRGSDLVPPLVTISAGTLGRLIEGAHIRANQWLFASEWPDRPIIDAVEELVEADVPERRDMAGYWRALEKQAQRVLDKAGVS